MFVFESKSLWYGCILSHYNPLTGQAKRRSRSRSLSVGCTAKIVNKEIANESKNSLVCQSTHRNSPAGQAVVDRSLSRSLPVIAVRCLPPNVVGGHLPYQKVSQHLGLGPAADQICQNLRVVVLQFEPSLSDLALCQDSDTSMVVVANSKSDSKSLAKRVALNASWSEQWTPS
jgi:hypothetical protein